MRDLQACVLSCMRELDALKIPYSKNVRFVVNNRAVSRLGLCRKAPNGFIIEIAAVLLDERTDERTGLRDTVIHELLHTCRGCMKHTGKWKEYAERVNLAYGYDIKRVSPRAGGPVPSELLPKPVYTVRCLSCGAVITRQKRSALITDTSRFRCAKCGGRLKVEG